MFGLFKRRCPLDIREKTWVELRLQWLINQLGIDPATTDRRVLARGLSIRHPDGRPASLEELPAGIWKRKDIGSPSNCAACHVSELRHNGKAVRVDGAPIIAPRAFDWAPGAGA